MPITLTDENEVRLTAFVGRSFLDDDKRVWYELRDILETLKSLGFRFEDAKESQARPISEKVRQLIIKNEIYIGLLTRRYKICDPNISFLERLQFAFGGDFPRNEWTASEWVIEEIGFAVGRDKTVILLVEEGVVFPASDLDADTEWILFNRNNLSAKSKNITEMISNLIAKKVTTRIDSGNEARTEPQAERQMEPTTASQPPTFRTHLARLRLLVESGSIVEADQLQAEMIDAEEDKEDKEEIKDLLLGVRATYGDPAALKGLKLRLAQTPNSYSAILSLFKVYQSFGQHNVAAELMLSSMKEFPIEKHSLILENAAQAMRKDGQDRAAIRLLIEHLPKENNETRVLSLLRSVAYSAEKMVDADLEAAFLERILSIDPTNNDARFRLAYLYSENGRGELAVYHYALLNQHVDWPHAVNNGAVSYKALGFKATGISEQIRVQDQHPLAKANIACEYSTAGFLQSAEDLAKAVLGSHNSEETANARARHALSEIANTRKNEADAILKLPQETKKERDFMAAYAQAYAEDHPAPFEGNFVTPHGEIMIRRIGSELTGTGSSSRSVTSHGILSLLAAGVDSPGVYVTTLKLNAELNGRAGRFTATINTQKDDAPSSKAVSRKIDGLLIVEKHNLSLQFLEREEKKTTIYEAGIRT